MSRRELIPEGTSRDRAPGVRGDVAGAERVVVPPPTLTAAQCRRLDTVCTEQFGIPSLVLMEHAALSALGVAFEMLRARRRRGHALGLVVLFCGPGNNGGDGLALARLLHTAGVGVKIVIPGGSELCGGDCAAQLAILRAMRLPFSHRCNVHRALKHPSSVVQREAPPGQELVIDALFGTGLSRPITGVFERAVERIALLRECGARVLSLDTPSGLNADSGVPVGGSCVRADRTITFAAMKPGLLLAAASRYTGRVSVGEIGAPRAAIELVLNMKPIMKPIIPAGLLLRKRTALRPPRA